MKKKIIISVLLIFSLNTVAQIRDSSITYLVDSIKFLKDKRDGKVYKTTIIGWQIWMAENLNFHTNDSWCYYNKAENCEQYGRLYNWYTANRVCPDGWHLPTDDDWTMLIENLGGKRVAAAKLKQGGSTDFNILMGGYLNHINKAYLNINIYSYFWTSTSSNNTQSWIRYVNISSSKIMRDKDDKLYGYSVRCIKNN